MKLDDGQITGGVFDEINNKKIYFKTENSKANLEIENLEIVEVKNLLDKYAKRKYGLSIQDLSSKQKNTVYYEIIESAGRDNTQFTTATKQLKILGKVGILITASIATYEILDAENKPKETLKQSMQIGGGVVGGWLAGFAVAPLCGPGAPICAIAVVLLGGTAGGIAGSMAADSLDEEIEEFTQWNIH